MYQLSVLSSDPNALKSLAAQAQKLMPESQIVLSMTLAWKPPDDDTEGLVVKIAEAIEPKEGDDLSYWKFLVGVRLHNDSWHLSEGDKLFSTRPDSKKVTDRIKKAFPDGKVDKNDLIFKKQIHFEDGSYKGIQYRFTSLGMKVFDEIERRRKKL